MPYTKQTWSDEPVHTTPVNAARLGVIEDGIEAAQALAENHTHPASAITSGTLGVARVAVGSQLIVDKVKNGNNWPSARPTARTDVSIEWVGNTDPGSIAIDGDSWDVTP